MTKKVYAKFIENKDQATVFQISSDLSTLKKWNGGEKNTNKTKQLRSKKSEKPKSESTFSEINEKIFDDFIAFYDIIPLLTTIPEFYPNTIIRKEVHGKFEECGEQIKSRGKGEIYSLDDSHLATIDRSLRKARSLKCVGPLFSRFYILGLVSHYDFFVDQIIRALIKKKNHIVINKDALIPYTDIFELKDMDHVKSYLIDKEVESVLRLSHEDQMMWFSKKLDIKMEPNSELMGRFVELCERRNLLAHAGGRISSSYLSKCEKFNIDINNLDVGKVLFVDKNYIETAVDTLIEMAFQLLHVIWEKVEPNSSKKASKSLINITYNLIQEERYNIAIRLIEFLLQNKSTKMDEATRKTHIINCANAKKLSGDESYIELIDTEDWTACTKDFVLCMFAIQDNVEDFINLMDPAVKSDSITLTDIREWPVFKNMRDNDLVRKVFLEKFSEPLIQETNSINQ